jgi:hypothetical protein
MDVNAENRSEIENLMKEERAISFDPECVRKKSNWSKTSRVYKFDDPSFEKETLLKDISNRSPKLETLLNKIDELDARDEKQYGKKFKHFIFSDLKYSNFGAKLLSSALVAKGMHLGYSAELISSKKERTKGGASDSESDSVSDSDSGSDSDADETKPVPTKKPKKQYKKIEMHPDDVLLKTKHNNFYLLSSVSVYDQNMTVDMKKHVLKTFNKRPDNIFGELARIIIMDSGFKEGIDLFDIKYIHIFEPPTVTADQKQVIGRGTRTCGQKGLEFHPQQGWPLYVYIYDLSIPEQLRGSFLNSASAMDLYLKTLNIDVRRFHFTNDLEKTSIYGTVDYELNKNIHSFSIPFSKVEQNDDANEIPLPEGAEFIYGGENEVSSETPMQYHGSGPKRKLRVVNEVAWMGFEELRKHVDQYYGEYKWDAVKMENLCKGTGKGTSGGAEVITYTPTQEFVRHYFTPSNPRKGILLWHSVGSGKTASAIATATSSFERQGYTILWVTRTTLKNDIWKNMFDQVCNERLRYQIQNQGLVIPEEQNKRMKLLSDAWRIRPMSYKQFSNLVAKQNDFYRRLVKKNGEADPLRKTLLIIDEAHKLYGGGLSSIEQPDMAAFHQAVMNSYMISKEDSVKLLLMTATPIAKDPMELIRLLNLCKTPAQQMPADFQEFSNQHLNEMGEFTKEGRDKYLDEIAGYISYLNREKDARQFAQPILQYIQTPMAAPKTLKQVGDFDQRIVREFLSSDIPELKQQILENQQQLVADLVDVDTNTFKHVMREVCQGKTGKEQKQCEKISKQNVKEMVRETKEYVKDIRRQIKELRDAIKNKNLLKREALATVSENRNKSEADYETYKESMVYNLKNKCAIRLEKESDFKTKVGEYPQIRSYNEDIANYEEQIKSLYAGLKSTMMAYKSNIARLQKIVKSSHTTALEKSVVRMNIRDVRLEQNKAKRETQKKIKAEEKDIQKNIKDTRKKREVTYKQLKKTVKKALSVHKKEATVIQKAERKLRKTLRKQEDYAENIQHGVLKNIVDKYVPKIKAELETESPKKVGVVDKETRKKKSQLPMSASTTTRKRCPNGYRKDKHGECVKKT